MIARLILVPLGICVAAAGALCALLAVGIVDRDFAALAGDLLLRVADMVANAASGDDGDARRIALLAGATWKLTLAVIFVPSLVVAVVTEILGLRSYLLQAVAAALLTIAMPVAMLPRTIAGTGLPQPLLAALGIAGFCAGSLYWILAGRGAGREAVRA